MAVIEYNQGRTPDAQKARAAVMSVGSNIGLVVLKYIVGYTTGSAAIISEGTHSLSDLVAASLAWFAIRKASSPADANHQYGHEKFESISGFAEGLLIIAAAIAIIVSASAKLMHGVKVERLDLGILVMAFSAVLNIGVSTVLRRVAAATDSLALHADAEHLRTDVYTSAGVFVGLGLARLTGWAWMDPVIALGVAVTIISAGVRIVRQSLDHLLDAAIPKEEERAIQHILDEHAHDYLEYHDLRTRKAGSVRHIDLHLVMDGDISLQHAHDVTERLENDIMAELPGSQVIIHTEPHSEALANRLS